MLINQQILKYILWTNESIEELTDISMEKLSGGGITTPQTTAGNNNKTPETGGNTATNPSLPGPGNLSLIPFYPPLPAAKLAHLGSLKGMKQTSNADTTKPNPSM